MLTKYIRTISESFEPVALVLVAIAAAALTHIPV